MSTVVLDTTDISEAEAALSETYARVHLTAAPSTTARTRVTRSALGSLTVDSLRYDYAFDYDSAPMDVVALVRVRRGTVLRRPARHRLEIATPGSVMAMTSQGGQPIAGTVSYADMECIRMDSALLTSLAGSGTRDGDPGPVRFTGGLPISHAANTQLSRAIDHVTRDILADPVAANSPLVAHSAQTYLAATMLAAFPMTEVATTSMQAPRDVTPLLLRRAMAFIDDNAHRPISVADIAAAVHVSPRSLQLMFRAHRDCTPREYLRRVRLEHAHRELVAAFPEDTTVAAVATRWGFAHAGRFAAYHRGQFGVSPQQSLRGRT
ncbi:MAG: helix-turn-helix transcriptional regulator [Gordonia paraffinivorans]